MVPTATTCLPLSTSGTFPHPSTSTYLMPQMPLPLRASGSNPPRSSHLPPVENSEHLAQHASPRRKPLWYPGDLPRLVLSALPLFLYVSSTAVAQPGALLDAMSQELNRNFAAL